MADLESAPPTEVGVGKHDMFRRDVMAALGPIYEKWRDSKSVEIPGYTSLVTVLVCMNTPDTSLLDELDTAIAKWQEPLEKRILDGVSEMNAEPAEDSKTTKKAKTKS